MGGLTRFVLLRTRGFLRVLARALLGTLGSGGGCAFFAGSFLGFALKLADGHGRRLVSGLLRSVLSRVPEPCLALHGAWLRQRDLGLAVIWRFCAKLDGLVRPTSVGAGGKSRMIILRGLGSALRGQSATDFGR
jgi:hypothetical protein